MTERVACSVGIITNSDVSVLSNNTAVSAAVDVFDICVSAYCNVGVSVNCTYISTAVYIRCRCVTVNGNLGVAENVLACSCVVACTIYLGDNGIVGNGNIRISL